MENIAINKRFQDLHFDSIQALHHRKKYKILLPETSDPNSAAVLSDDTCDLSVAVIVSIHVPADQTQSFAPGQEPAVCSF